MCMGHKYNQILRGVLRCRAKAKRLGVFETTNSTLFNEFFFKALAQANADLASAQDKLAVIKRKVMVSNSGDV